MQFETRAIHDGYQLDEHNRAVMPPIYQTSVFAFHEIGESLPFSYARVKHPTREALEHCLASLEEGVHGLAFASGMAAIDATLRALLKPGDEILVGQDVYGGTYRLLQTVFVPMGVTVTFLSDLSPERLQATYRSSAKVLWLESPSNPLLHLVDLAALANQAKTLGLKVVVDNTFATPYLQRPLSLGCDVVVHSATKYLGGHSDVLLGALVVKDEALYRAIRLIQYSAGAVPGPQDCFLVLRGIKTLALRMQRHCESAQQIAEFLSEHPRVAKVYYPGLPDHPQHHLIGKQMTAGGGVVTIRLKEAGVEAANKVVKALRLFALAESLGGVESLVNHSFSMSHGSMPKAYKTALGIEENVLRLSIGIEAVEDLLADLAQALTI